MSFDLKKLAKKFPEEDIEWRIQQCGNNSWALVVPYITNRAIMQRLDDAVGPGNWKNEFTASPCNTGYQCGISIKIDNEWVTRWDGSELVGSNTIDKVKSTMSSAMKRTGVQWGIGRYLYQFDVGFATVKPVDTRKQTDTNHGFIYHENKKKQEKFQWKPPALEAWALPLSTRDISLYLKMLSEVGNLDELRFAWQQVYKAATSENDDEITSKLTAAKDAAKVRIATAQEEQIKGDTEKVTSWLDKQLKAFEIVPNESAVTSLKESLLKEISKRTKNTVVELGPLREAIETTYINRINQIQGA